MPKLKVQDDELDIEELEEAEYEEGGNFASYSGEIPATGTQLIFRVTKAWWTYTKDDDPMLKVLCVAEDGEGDLEEFDGLPAWENMALTAGAKFKWQPFLDQFGLTLRDIKSKTIVAAEDDNMGAPIEKIGTWEPGSDDAVFLGMVKKERYNGQWQAHIQEWLDPDEPEQAPAKKPAKPAAKARAKPTPASRGSSASRSRRSRSEEPEEDEPEAEPDEAEEEPPTRTRRTAGARASGRSSARSSGRSRRQSAQDVKDEDEPPF